MNAHEPQAALDEPVKQVEQPVARGGIGRQRLGYPVRGEIVTLVYHLKTVDSTIETCGQDRQAGELLPHRHTGRREDQAGLAAPHDPRLLDLWS